MRALMLSLAASRFACVCTPASLLGQSPFVFVVLGMRLPKRDPARKHGRYHISCGGSKDHSFAEPWSHPSGIVPQLQNVVSTVNLGCQLDLASIAQRARNAEYNPKRFAACIVRIRDPKTTALMFNSGKMVIAGAKSEEQSRLAGRKARTLLLLCLHMAYFHCYLLSLEV